MSNKDIYEMNSEDYKEVNRMIDEDSNLNRDYDECEWKCKCGERFMTEEGKQLNGDVVCPRCRKIVLCDEMRIEED